ncbi:hypothetical protein T459_22400 [Capsicum annuum]|uniref:General transcription factor 3C polypeptide 1 winged-helix domain-containing protein n=1 Tax=Capsicum annuum TaxID=4072 RepID=A0A2G2YPL1_CAPAN|nr:hypothetical protein T459_22400 [Capsicum annuum]
MDAIVNTALEEICSNGSSGLHISKLWQKLHSPISNLGLKLCPNVKKALWFNLIDIPNLKFEANNGAVYSCMDSCVRSIDESENLDLKIVAPEYMCDGFIGVYDVDASDAKLSMHERRVLRALATVSFIGVYDIEASDAKLSKHERCVLCALSIVSSIDSCVRSLDESERLDLKIVAPEYMSDGFIGVYDVEASDAKLSIHLSFVLLLLLVYVPNVYVMHMCDGFIGVYDVEATDARLSIHERRVLRALATVRFVFVLF